MDGGRSGRKRKRKAFAEENQSHSGLGMGQTLQHLRQEAQEPLPNETKDERSEEWEIVMPKRQKKQSYPGLWYNEIHRLQNMVKLADLQGLILYCLADGSSPQWVSIRNHKTVRKAVVLFVPGLEKGMFDGNIPLQESADVTHVPAQNLVNGNEIHAQENYSSQLPDFGAHNIVANCAQSNRFEKPKPTNPDDYLPLSLDTSQLPDAVKPLADLFSHVWPIRAPGDDRLNQVHSPLQAILQSPLPNSQEKKAEKTWKGPKPAKESKDWANQRTKIVEYVHKGEELLENEYVLHPVCWQSVGLDLEAEEKRRLADKQPAADRWLNTQVEKLDDGVVPEKDTPKGSVTAGKKILAIDCEMCTIQGGGSALTRVAVLGWDEEVVMDEFVKPETPIIDYLTP